MMICPETFYEETLKGKNAEQIMTVIRSLKQEIGHLKNVIEHPDYVASMCPSESTILWCNRLYLARAKQALEEQGVKYTPSQAEIKAAEFDDNIPFICKMILSIGGYFQGNETITVTINGENLRLWVSHSSIPMPSNFDIEKNYPINKEDFLSGLYDLHIGEWRKDYNPSRFGYVILDGTQWELEIHYSNGRKPLKIYGDNSYPYNFDKLKELLGIYDFEDEDDDS